MDLVGECGLIDIRKGQGQRALKIREVDSTLFLQVFTPIFFIGFSQEDGLLPNHS